MVTVMGELVERVDEEDRVIGVVDRAEAIEKGWVVEDTTRWRGGVAIPDLVISREDEVREPMGHKRAVKDTYWIEVVDTHDPRKKWEAAGYSLTDVLTMDISGCLGAGDMRDAAMGVIP